MVEVKKWEAKLSHKVIHTFVTIFVTLLLVGGGAYAYWFFKNDTKGELRNNPGRQITSTIAATPEGTVHFTEPTFTFELPIDWKKTGELTTGPYHEYTFQASKKNADNRWLYVYVDSLPTDMAVNKVVRVEANGDKLTHGEVSNNCTEFTTQSSPRQLKVPARWDGIDFLCDYDSKTRNVVGTSAPGSMNKVVLQNVGFTKRAFFFVYEDNNYNPDYSILYNMLDSFTAK